MLAKSWLSLPIPSGWTTEIQYTIFWITICPSFYADIDALVYIHCGSWRSQWRVMVTSVPYAIHKGGEGLESLWVILKTAVLLCSGLDDYEPLHDFVVTLHFRYRDFSMIVGIVLRSPVGICVILHYSLYDMWILFNAAFEKATKEIRRGKVSRGWT